MDISRMLGIGIVMIVPAFVGSGAIWHFLNNWLVVFIWIIIMAGLYVWILKKSSSRNNEEPRTQIGVPFNEKAS